MTLQTLLKPPYPQRDAVAALTTQVKDYIRTQRPQVGALLATDTELMKFSNLSRSTVRRALNQLKKEGWVLRRRGVGTFVGQKAAQVQTTTTDTAVRLAVLVHRIGDLAHDWYTPLVLEGIESVADRYGLAVDLLGQSDRDIESVCQRLERSRAKVLACLCGDPLAEMVIMTAQRLGMQCIIAGTHHAQLGLPAVVENNYQAVDLAVEHLWSAGHRRIALVLPRIAQPWVFERHESFAQAMLQRGRAEAEALVHWLPLQMPAEDAPVAERLHQFLANQAITAVIPGDSNAMRCVDTLVRSGRVSVPGDLSVVGLEQDQKHRRWLGTADTVHVYMAIRRIGEKIGEYSHQLAGGGSVPLKTIVPSEIVPGNSVQAISTAG